MACLDSRFAGVFAGVMQLMAAIMVVGALSARWGSLDNSSGGRVAKVHMDGVTLSGVTPAEVWTWDEIVDDCSSYCSEAKSAKSAFQASFAFLALCTAVDIGLWFMGDVAWKFQDIESITRNGRRRVIGTAVGIVSILTLVLRAGCLIACWSAASSLLDAINKAYDNDWTQPSMEVSQGVMFLAFLFNILAIAFDFHALRLHTREKKHTTGAAGLLDAYTAAP